MAIANDIQIEASDNTSNPFPQKYSGSSSPSITETIVLRKKTPTGSTGTVTIVNGKVTAYTKPT